MNLQVEKLWSQTIANADQFSMLTNTGLTSLHCGCVGVMTN